MTVKLYLKSLTISHAHTDDFSLLDVETVDRCLKQMSKCKAPGIDGV